MKNELKRLISLILALAMSLSLLSANVWAEEYVEDSSETSQMVEGCASAENAPNKEETDSKDHQERIDVIDLEETGQDSNCIDKSSTDQSDSLSVVDNEESIIQNPGESSADETTEKGVSAHDKKELVEDTEDTEPENALYSSVQNEEPESEADHKDPEDETERSEPDRASEGDYLSPLADDGEECVQHNIRDLIESLPSDNSLEDSTGTKYYFYRQLNDLEKVIYWLANDATVAHPSFSISGLDQAALETSEMSVGRSVVALLTDSPMKHALWDKLAAVEVNPDSNMITVTLTKQKYVW